MFSKKDTLKTTLLFTSDLLGNKYTLSTEVSCQYQIFTILEFLSVNLNIFENFGLITLNWSYWFCCKSHFTFLNWAIVQMDVSKAFLRASLEESIDRFNHSLNNVIKSANTFWV